MRLVSQRIIAPKHLFTLLAPALLRISDDASCSSPWSVLYSIDIKRGRRKNWLLVCAKTSSRSRQPWLTGFEPLDVTDALHAVKCDHHRRPHIQQLSLALLHRRQQAKEDPATRRPLVPLLLPASTHRSSGRRRTSRGCARTCPWPAPC
jgi:hypothetical protein